jgi:hypothetical protein
MGIVWMYNFIRANFINDIFTQNKSQLIKKHSLIKWIISLKRHQSFLLIPKFELH